MKERKLLYDVRQLDNLPLMTSNDPGAQYIFKFICNDLVIGIHCLEARIIQNVFGGIQLSNLVIN